jgi:hypothetical protein
LKPAQPGASVHPWIGPITILAAMSRTTRGIRVRRKSRLATNASAPRPPNGRDWAAELRSNTPHDAQESKTKFHVQQRFPVQFEITL